LLIAFFEDDMLEHRKTIATALLMIAICGVTSAQQESERLFPAA
jgi:hypothetical protein